MRIVLSAIIVSLAALTAYYLIVRVPILRDYKDCYNQAYSIFNEREKGIIIRRFNQGEAAICLENKQIILGALKCIQITDSKSQAGVKEQDILKKIAQGMLFGPKDMEQILVEHNASCPAANTLINLDTRTNTWF